MTKEKGDIGPSYQRKMGWEDLMELASEVDSGQDVFLHTSAPLTHEEYKGEMLALELAERRDFLDMRKGWATFIGALLFLFLVFQVVLTFCVGLGSLDFTMYEWLIELIIGTNFGQIIALALVVVKFLFPNNHPISKKISKQLARKS